MRTYKERRRAAIRERLRAAKADGVDVTDRAAMHRWTMQRLERLRVSVTAKPKETQSCPS